MKNTKLQKTVVLLGSLILSSCSMFNIGNSSANNQNNNKSSTASQAQNETVESNLLLSTNEIQTAFLKTLQLTNFYLEFFCNGTDDIDNETNQQYTERAITQVDGMKTHMLHIATRDGDETYRNGSINLDYYDNHEKRTSYVKEWNSETYRKYNDIESATADSTAFNILNNYFARPFNGIIDTFAYQTRFITPYLTYDSGTGLYSFKQDAKISCPQFTADFSIWEEQSIAFREIAFRIEDGYVTYAKNNYYGQTSSWSCECKLSMINNALVMEPNDYVENETGLNSFATISSERLVDGLKRWKDEHPYVDENEKPRSAFEYLENYINENGPFEIANDYTFIFDDGDFSVRGICQGVSPYLIPYRYDQYLQDQENAEFFFRVFDNYGTYLEISLPITEFIDF